jgi:hypothetical protein
MQSNHAKRSFTPVATEASCPVDVRRAASFLIAPDVQQGMQVGGQPTSM